MKKDLQYLSPQFSIAEMNSQQKKADSEVDIESQK